MIKIQMSNLIREVYNFTYPNGFKQLKYVITTEDYNYIIRPLLDIIENEKDKIKKERDYKLISEVSALLREYVGNIDINYELITDSGRYYKAITHGFLPPAYSGDIPHKVLTNKLNKNE
jgi:hypothetical protein